MIGTKAITVSNAIPPLVLPAMIVEGSLVNCVSVDDLLCSDCAMSFVVTVDSFPMACVRETRLLIMTRVHVKINFNDVFCW